VEEIPAVGVPGCAELGTTIGLLSTKPPPDPVALPTHPVIVTVCAALVDAVVCAFVGAVGVVAAPVV